MWYLKACRSCLTTTGNLIRIGPQARKLFCVITGLESEEDDGFPQYFCAECFVLIKKALQFRRRSRRAHFVLKEIYAIKKQVGQADVEIVNRHKTNLISPYSLWKPENAVAYSYKTADAVDTKPEELTPDIEAALKESLSPNIKQEFDIKCDVEAKTIKIEIPKQNSSINQPQIEPVVDTKIKTDLVDYVQELVKEEVDTLKCCSILVDIKPANWQEIERQEEERKKNERLVEIEIALQEIHGDDFYDDNNEQMPEDIDMEDVFKGLKDESPKESESEPEIQPDPEPRPQSKKKKRLKKKHLEEKTKLKSTYMSDLFHRSSKIVEYAFSDMKIKLLSHEKQVEAFIKKLNTEPYCKSLYRCNVCVKMFADVDALYKHVDYHNTKLKFEFGCKVCADRFETEERLNQHSAFCHWYEYRCKRCKGKHYTLESVINCYKSMESPTRLDKHFKIRCLSPQAMYTTLEAWTGDKKCSYGACQQCKIYFNTEKQYKCHVDRHNEPKTKKYYECDVCSQKFISFSYMEKHMVYWHLFSYSCRKCKIQFRNRAQAQDHMIKGSCSWMCYVCNQSFQMKHRQIEHIYSAHRTDCGMCGHVSTSPVKMYIHQLKMHGYFRLNTEAELYDVRYYCKDCGIYFMDEKLLFKHLSRMRHAAAREYENGCRSCMLLFDSSEERAEHKITCENTYPKQCEFCTKIVADREEYQSHKVVEHRHRAPVIPEKGDSRLCELCGKTVKHIKDHVKKHFVEKEVAIECKYCPNKSLTRTKHVSHVIFNHTSKPYRCTMCKLRFVYRSNCRDHILKTHAPVQLYHCEVCSRKFSHLDYLHDHCLKAHSVDLKKQDKTVFLSKRMFGKIYTYPHMEIDGSHIDPSILEKTPIELCDYMDENEKRVPYTQVFFFDLNVNPLKGQPKKKKNKKLTREQIRAIYLRKKKRRLEKKIAAAKENESESLLQIEPIEIDTIKEEMLEDGVDTLIINDTSDMNYEEMEVETEVETEDIVGQLIEKDGQYFVLANGVLYTLEEDCVDKLKEKDGVMQIVND